MRKFCPVAYIASVGIVTQLNAQSVNWRELTNELVSTNSGTRDAARDKMLSVIIPKLISESPEAVDRDLQEILKASAGSLTTCNERFRRYSLHWRMIGSMEL